MKAILISCAAAALLALCAGIPAAQAEDNPCAEAPTTQAEAEACKSTNEEEEPTIVVEEPGDPAAFQELLDERYGVFGEEFFSCLLNGLAQGLPLKQIQKDCAPTAPPGAEGAEGPGFGEFPGGDPTGGEIYDPTDTGTPPPPPGSGDYEPPLHGADDSDSYGSGLAVVCSAGDPGIGQSAGAQRIDPYGSYTWGKKSQYERGLSQEESRKLKEEAIRAFEQEQKTLDEENKKFDELVDKEEKASAAADAWDKAGDPAKAEQLRKEANEYRQKAVEQAHKSMKQFQKMNLARDKADADPNTKPLANTRPSREPSACAEGLQALKELMWECHRTNGQSSVCKDLEAKATHCPDQTTINVDPEQGHSCTINVDMEALKNAWVAHCEELKDPGPDGQPCGPPTPDGADPDRAGELKDWCNNPMAHVLPDSEECLPSGTIAEFGTPNLHELMVWGLNKLGGPIFDVPSGGSGEPPPQPGPQPDPNPGDLDD
jgi:hypothetical protein